MTATYVKALSPYIDLDSSSKRYVKQHLKHFSAGIQAYSANQRGVVFMPPEDLMDDMFGKVGVSSNIANAVRLVTESVLFNIIATHRNGVAAGDSIGDIELWRKVNETVDFTLSQALPTEGLAKLYHTSVSVERIRITELPIQRTVWTVAFDEFNTTVTFVIMGYIKPMGSTHLGVTFVSNEPTVTT